MVWNPLHYLLGGTYLVALLALGVLASRRRETSNQFLNATASLPLWVCIISCIAANCGSLDVIAMMALGAQYGMLACHFYWIGAVPALVIVAFWLLPAYARGRYPTVLDFIAQYYGQATRSAVALCMAVMMLMLAGVCLCAVAQTASTFLGWNFGFGVAVTAAVVLFYTALGGLRATVYTELLHFFVVLSAIVPLFFLVVHDFGGISGLMAHIPAARAHAWKALPFFAPAAEMDQVGVIVGLGAVLGFGFWSTDFVQMQRALAVRRREQVPFVPLSMAAAKMVFAFLIVLPGVVAPLVLRGQLGNHWNTTLPSLMLHYFSPAWVALGVMGLSASLISTFANNISGFSSAWVQGVYQAWLRPEASESHYLWVGRSSNVVAVVLAVLAAYSALSYQSLMEYIQMILSTFNAPLFALVATAAVAPKLVRGSGLPAIFTGLATSAAHQTMVRIGLLHYGSRMSANFYAAILSFSVTLLTVLIVGRVRGKRTSQPMEEAAIRVPLAFTTPTLLWGILVTIACLAFNVWLR